MSVMVAWKTWAAWAHSSRIFLKQDKKVECQLDRNKMSEERGGPSREEGNFPQVCCVYVGLVRLYTKEGMLEKF